MPVLPDCINPLQDQKSLYHFLLACQDRSIVKNHPQIANLATEIEPVDLLAVLHELNQQNQPHFYLEKRLDDMAIVALDTAAMTEIEGKQRFKAAQHFIQTCLEHLTSNRPIDDELAAPRFFCNFTFFDKNQDPNSAFAAATIFLPKFQIIRQGDRYRVVVNLLIHDRLKIETVTETIWNNIQAIRLAKYGIFNLPDRLRPQLSRWQIRDIHNFQSAVAGALQVIHHQHLDKLVLAHAVDVTARLPFQPIQSLHHLRQLYPDCYVFSTSNGKGQSFIGASPERLIQIRDRQLFTDALAGSAPRGKTLVDDAEFANRLLSSPKERHEHQVVVDFIRDRLAQFDLKPQLATVPGLLQLSNIQHLHTPMQASIPGSLHPLDIVAELHPTPAVAGLPREIACDHIRQYEPFGRSLYAAPLGWVDAQGNAEFIVGIRSALIEGNRARLYAGAGIVAGSQPEREFAEVKLKLQALMQALV
jgi:menaquinone-specific isochorismate synthase